MVIGQVLTLGKTLRGGKWSIFCLLLMKMTMYVSPPCTVEENVKEWDVAINETKEKVDDLTFVGDVTWSSIRNGGCDDVVLRSSDNN